MFDLRNKKVTIIGAARSGLAAADLVFKCGGIPKISDSQETASISSNIILEKGGHSKVFIQDSDYVVLSPGVSIHSQSVKWAQEKDIEVMGEVELAYRLCPCPIIAVTGSNGKTTTSTLIAEILKKDHRSVSLCGNIGHPFSAQVMNLKKTDIVVLEISSFQLESIIHFKPHIAAWLNFSQNHLDRHKDLNEYFEAKRRIFKNQDQNDFAVLNSTQKEFHDLAKGLKSKVLFFNGSDAPTDITNPNYLAAMTAVKALGISEEISRQVFAEFKGVEHRLELVRTLHGVDYINDSKSTTAEAGRWALERMSKPAIMICGGRDKHIDFSVLKTLVSRKVKHMIAIGEARGLMKNTFSDVVEVETASSFEDAVKAAQKKAKNGEAVVLSPMCASFDMFKDYEHRGQVFKEIVNKLV
jgi:UDP-N-acetylmuramoylalanine--D-glutamate ligase